MKVKNFLRRGVLSLPPMFTGGRSISTPLLRVNFLCDFTGISNL
jgi:hypothetical protein